MRYLITGGTGFVGSHMIDFLLKEEKDSVVYVMRRWRSREENVSHLLYSERVKFIEADLLDLSSLHYLLSISSPDVIYHFASQSFPGASFKLPVVTLHTNIIGTVNLLEAIKDLREKNLCDPLIVSVSSSEVYGNPTEEEVPIKESNPIRAANPYSISKVGHDLMSQYYYKAYGLRIIVTRMFSHEGMRRGKEFALSNFAFQIVDNERKYQEDVFNGIHDSVYEVRVGNLDSIRTYSHIEDAIYAYYLCSKSGKVGEVYNIGGRQTRSVREALENLLSKSDIPRNQFSIVVDPCRIRPTDITLQIPDCRKFMSDTGWRPIKELDDITADLLNYWRKIL